MWAAREAGTAGGLAALWAGLQLGVVAAVLSAAQGLLPPARPYAWYAAVVLTAVGYALTTAGTLRPRSLLTMVRSRHLTTSVGVGGGGILLLVLLSTAWQPRPSAGLLLAVAGAQLGLAAAWYRWSDPRVVHPPLQPRGAVTSLIVLLVVGHLGLIPVLLHDAYPFAVYPMYSRARVDPYFAERVVFVTDDGAGGERSLSVGVSRVALLTLAQEDAVEDLAGIAKRLAEEEDGEVTVYLERLQVALHPAPPGVEVQGRQELVTVGR